MIGIHQGGMSTYDWYPSRWYVNTDKLIHSNLIQYDPMHALQLHYDWYPSRWCVDKLIHSNLIQYDPMRALQLHYDLIILVSIKVACQH